MNTHTKTKIPEMSKTLKYIIEVARALSYNQNFILRGFFSPAPVLYTCLKS